MIACIVVAAMSSGADFVDLDAWIVQPFAVSSPSRQWRTEIEPGDRFGMGGSEIRVSRDGVVVHETALAFTLATAQVTDEGYAIGIGRTTHGPFDAGEMVIAVVAPDGKLVREEREAMKGSRYLHAKRDPVILGFHVAASGDRFLLRTFDSRNDDYRERWWIFSVRDAATKEVRVMRTYNEFRVEELEEAIGLIAPVAPRVDEEVVAPERTLREESHVSLSSAKSPPALRDLCDIGVGRSGEWIAVRRNARSDYTSVLLDRDGSIVREVPWRIPEELVPFDWSIRRGARHGWWLRRIDQGSREDCWWLDGVTGEARLVARRDDPSLEDLELAGPARQRLAFNDEVALLDGGNVAVLTTIPGTVTVYDSAGDELRTIDLAKAFGYEPRYASEIHRDRDGGMMIEDFNGKIPLVRLSVEGGLRSRLRPHFASGHAPEELYRHARVRPDGVVWTHDSGAIYELDDDGLVVRTIGAPLDRSALEAPGAVTLDSLGRVWITDERSGSIHGFDAAGAPVFVAQFAPQDGDPARFGSRVVARPDGGILVEREANVVRFDANGGRLGRLPEPEIALELEGDRFLLGEFEGPLRVVDLDLEPVTSFEKAPSGRWSFTPREAVRAADGRIAALMLGAIVMLDASGAPLSELATPQLPFGASITIAGPRLAISGWNPEALVYSFDRKDWERVRFEGADSEVRWTAGLDPSGEFLLAIDSKTHVLRRYALAR